MRKGILCDQCGKLIESGNTVYHRKHNYDEAFCSRECLISFVTENIEIRTRTE